MLPDERRESTSERASSIDEALRSLSAPDDSPRLGIIHLMGWMAGSALLLATHRQNLNDDQLPEPGAYRIVAQVFVTLHCVIYGLALVGLTTALRRWWRHQRVFHQPGHWLVAIAGGAALVQAVTMAVFALQKDVAPFIADQGMLVALAMEHFVQAAFFLWSAVHFRSAKAWMWLILTLSVQTAFEAISLLSITWGSVGFYQYQQAFEIVIGTAQILALIFAIRSDRQARRRDWLHGAGVFLVAWGVAFRLVWWALATTLF